jgi:hypothetical protein
LIGSETHHGPRRAEGLLMGFAALNPSYDLSVIRQIEEISDLLQGEEPQVKDGTHHVPSLLAAIRQVSRQRPGQVPTASLTHFLVKLVLAAPASFFSEAWAVQVAVASFWHFVMKLLSAAPARFLSVAWALHDVVASCAKAVAANVENSAASNIFFIGFSSGCVEHKSFPRPSSAARRLYT